MVDEIRVPDVIEEVDPPRSVHRDEVDELGCEDCYRGCFEEGAGGAVNDFKHWRHNRWLDVWITTDITDEPLRSFDISRASDISKFCQDTFDLTHSLPFTVSCFPNVEDVKMRIEVSVIRDKPDFSSDCRGETGIRPPHMEHVRCFICCCVG